MKKEKLRSSQEELECVCTKLKAVQDKELDDATKDKICIEIFMDFNKKSVIAMHLAGEAVRDAEQALEEANEVFADKMRVLDVIAHFVDEAADCTEYMSEERIRNNKVNAMQKVRAAEEAMEEAQEASEKVFEGIEKTIFNGAEELIGTEIGEAILMNVLMSCSVISRDWWRSNDAEVKADEALRAAIYRAERTLGKKITSHYI